jgi:cyclopropane fatty-acyl-phospholipid synthase-like methyltransferase
MPTMDDSPQRTVEAGYNEVARQYAELEGTTPWPRMRWLNKLLADLPRGSSILDLGCGSGDPVDVYLAHQHRVTGVDISAEQLRRARLNVPQAHFIKSDLSEVTFPIATFDAVVSFYTIEHVPRRFHSEVLRRVRGWLRPGGRLLLTIEAGEYADVTGTWLGVPMFLSCYGPERNKQMIQEAGFRLLESAVEVQREGDKDVPYLWILAARE